MFVLNRKTVLSLGIAGLLVVLSAPAQLVMAHGGATGVVKERMKMMKAMGKKMRTMKTMLNGKMAYDSQRMARAAKAVADAASQMARLFPEGSMHKPTEALPAIWLEWDRFTALGEQLEAEAKKLQDESVSSNPTAAI